MVKVKKVYRRFVSLFFVFAVILTATSCSTEKAPEGTSHTVQNAQALSQNEYTKKPTKLTKKEAVFVTVSGDGSVVDVSVTDRLTSDSEKVRVDDISPLRDIKNIKGNEKPKIDGQNVVWNMESRDLYYSGSTDKSLPVEFKIEYRLNGDKVESDGIEGKSGRLDINIESENKEYRTFEQNGKIMKIYTPFVVVGGMMLTKADSSATVENGVSVGDGQKEIVIGFMLPGLLESLGLDEEKIKIPESFSVSYESSSHEKPQLMFAMIPISLSGGENFMSSLFSGTEGMTQALSGFGELFSSVSSDLSVRSIIEQSDKISELASTATGAINSFSNQRALIEVLSKHLTAENARLIEKFAEDLKGVEITKYAQLLSDPEFRAMIDGMGTLSESLSALLPKITEFANDLSKEEVKKSLESLPQTIEQLNSLSVQIQQNEELSKALSKLSKSENAKAVSDIFKKAEELLRGGTADALAQFSKNSDELTYRINRVIESGKEYSVFTDAPKDAETSVYFVFKTQ